MAKYFNPQRKKQVDRNDQIYRQLQYLSLKNSFCQQLTPAEHHTTKEHMSVTTTTTTTRIKKTFFFSTKQACLFYYCDLPFGYRILKSNNSTQQMGELVCILCGTGQVLISKLASKPNLNVSEQWNESYFSKLFTGMQNFILQQVQNDEDVDIELQNSTQTASGSQKRVAVSSKVLLVRDPTIKQEEIYLLRCMLKQSEFHRGRVGVGRLWEEFEKYGRFMRREENGYEKHMVQLQQIKQEKFRQINTLLTIQNTKKNALREKLTQIWRQKLKKFKQLSIGRQHLLPSLMAQFTGDEQESSLSICDISNSDMVNSQAELPLTGSLFAHSLCYRVEEGNGGEQGDGQ